MSVRNWFVCYCTRCLGPRAAAERPGGCLRRGVQILVAFEQQQPVEDVQIAEGSFRGEQGTEVSISAGMKHGRALLLKKIASP